MPYKDPQKAKEYQKQWRKKHPDYWQKWEKSHSDYRKEYWKQWRKQNPDYYRNYEKNRPKRNWPKRNWRKRKGLSGNDFWREKVRQRDKYTCQLCGKIWKSGQRRFDVHKKGLDDNGKYEQGKDLKDWITLCHKCHCRLHYKLRK